MTQSVESAGRGAADDIQDLTLPGNTLRFGGKSERIGRGGASFQHFQRVLRGLLRMMVTLHTRQLGNK